MKAVSDEKKKGHTRGYSWSDTYLQAELFKAVSSPNKLQVVRHISIQRLREKVIRLRGDIIDQLDSQLDDVLEEVLQDVEGIEGDAASGGEGGDATPPTTTFTSRQQNGTVSTVSPSPSRLKRPKLLEKEFVMRRSLLTELLEINHIRTIYHIFVAMLILFSLNTIVYDLLDKGSLDFRFDMIIWALGKFPLVMWLWVCMTLSQLVILFPLFSHWAHSRSRTPHISWYDIIWLAIYCIYQLLFIILPVHSIITHDLPPASTVVITTEQVRLIMKAHAFVRENIYRALTFKQHQDTDKCDEVPSPCPDFSKYLYFLFAPTLIYRDNYPRTAEIRWNYVVTNFGQVVACLFYTYYIFYKFCVPVFRNFSHLHMTPRHLLLSVFGCMFPGTLVLFIGFFAILHSWLNAFAEMLRFGDRMFYRDWWNSTSFANYYRTWNVVVHDWLYAYIYRDFHALFPSKRATSMFSVFLLSAVVHEYVLIISFRFFYPVLFCMFAGGGFGFIFLTDRKVSRSWNVFMWVALFIGLGGLMCLYSQEWYARLNCPIQGNKYIDLIIPRSWFCTPDIAKAK